MSHSETAEESQGHLDREPTALWSKERMRAGMRVVEAALVYQRAYEAHEKCLATHRTSLIACRREHEALLTAQATLFCLLGQWDSEKAAGLDANR